MFRSGIVSVSLCVGVFVLMISGLAFALDAAQAGPAIEMRIENACHRMIKSRSPHGHRDLRTFTYEIEAPYVGVATGSLKSQISSKRWSQINWTCRVHPKSGRILRVEFEGLSMGNRLLASSRF